MPMHACHMPLRACVRACLFHVAIVALNTLDRPRHLTLQLLPIALLLLLLTILQSLATVTLEHAMLVAVLLVAKGAISRDARNAFFAVLEGAADLLGGAAAEGEGHVERALGGDVVVAEGVRGLAEVFASEDDAQGGGLGDVGAEGEEGAEGGDGGALGDGEREGWEKGGEGVSQCGHDGDQDGWLTVACNVLDEDLHGL